jgi:hypothetical protein
MGDDTSVRFRLPPDEAVSPALVLGVVRRRGVSRVSVCLPRPGLPLGLGGPPAFNVDALEAGEAMLWQGAGVGCVPYRLGAALEWRASEAAAPAYLPDVSTGDRELRTALAAATARLADLDVARWNPDVADALLNLRSPRTSGPPLPFVTPQAAQLAVTATRCLTIVALARADEGGTVSAAEMAARQQALSGLEDAARTGLVAACSATD